MSAMVDDSDRSLLSIIGEDVAAAEQRYLDADTGETRRSLIRTLVLSIEAAVWMFRDNMLSTSEETDDLREDERATLAPFTYVIDDKGKVKKRTQQPSMTAILRLSIKVTKRVVPTFDPDLGGQEWRDFQSMIEIRNRLTHPKSQDDLQISREQIETVINAFRWIMTLMEAGMVALNLVHKQRVEHLREMADLLKAGDPEALALYEQALRERDA